MKIIEFRIVMPMSVDEVFQTMAITPASIYPLHFTSQSVFQYERGHRYALAKVNPPEFTRIQRYRPSLWLSPLFLQSSRLGTGKGEGVEVLQQETFQNAQGAGLFLHKRIHLSSRLPRCSPFFNLKTTILIVIKLTNIPYLPPPCPQTSYRMPHTLIGGSAL